MPPGVDRPMGRGAKIRVPASTSNLGAGFDAVGLALQLYLTVEIRELEHGPSRLDFEGQDSRLVPTDDSNLIWRTMIDVAKRAEKILPPFLLQVENEIPITKGLGSSASACLAGVVAADFLCGLDLGRDEWLEIVAASEGHPDNAAPALEGGLVACISSGKILWSRIKFPSHWTVVAVTPEYELETKRARAALPEQISHRDAVFNVQRAAFLIAQLAQGRREGLRVAMEDRLHQPYRSSMIPGLREILELRDLEGLIGLALSGAGPTVVAFADSNADEIGTRIREVFESNGLAAEVRLIKADNEGLVLKVLEDPRRAGGERS